MIMVKAITSDEDVEELQRCLAAAEDDRDQLLELAILRLNTIDELRADLRARDAELEQLRRENR